MRRFKGQFILMIGVLLTASLLPVSPAAAGRHVCFGEKATIVGTNKDDRIEGTPQKDVIVARDGQDTIYSSGGDDLICAGRSGDLGRDDDYVRAGGGNDRVDGGLGRDWLVGQKGKDKLIGGPSKDNLFGQDGHDVLIGGKGRDTMQGDDGSDLLRGGEDSDLLEPGPGNDHIFGSNDGVVGDTSFFDSSGGRLLVNLAKGFAQGAEGRDSVSDVENLVGSGHNQTLVGDEQNNRISGGFMGSETTVKGKGGDDCLSPEAETSHVFGNRGRDTYTAVGHCRFGSGPSHSYFASSMSADLLKGTISYPDEDLSAKVRSIEGIIATEYEDEILGDMRRNFLYGGRSDDVIQGRSGNDLLVGESGLDRLDGGAGVDNCDGELAQDCE
jgi:Ca2+-binding RTX toxin-like protein